MKKKLTIGIPTYNRSDYLKKNLERLLPQVEQCKDKVEVIVSDNCSQDSTKDVVESFMEKYQDILYYNRNKKNEGYLYNFNECVTRSSADYILLLGDDDEVVMGFVVIVLELISNYNLDLLHYNFFVCNTQTNTLRSYYSEFRYNGLVEVYNNPYSFIETFWDGPSFMSSLVFKKEIWNSGFNRFEENCYGYDWLMYIYGGIKDRRCAYYSVPLVIQFQSPLHFYSDLWAKYAVIGKSRIFENLECDCPGIFRLWGKCQKTREQLYFTLLNTACNKQLYKKISGEMRIYLPSYKHILVFNCAIHSPKVFVNVFYKPLFKILFGFRRVFLKITNRFTFNK